MGDKYYNMRYEGEEHKVGLVFDDKGELIRIKYKTLTDTEFLKELRTLWPSLKMMDKIIGLDDAQEITKEKFDGKI